MADKAFITPAVLKWARETAKMAEGEAAAKVQVSAAKLIEWEAGTSQPTIRQAQLLAKAYKRPFAVFFLPDIPWDFHPLQDFRKPGSKALSTGSVFIIRDIQQKQAWISENAQENGEPALPFVGRYTVADSPRVVAQDILQTLAINPANYGGIKPIKAWIDAAESNGIFVSRTSFIHSRLKLDSNELQGFAIADPHAPFVFVNSEDWDAAQLFTLVHELVHIWIAETGISNVIELTTGGNDKEHPIERFCDEVTGHALIPTELITSYGRSIYQNYNEVFRIARNLGVSTLAFLVRALHLQLISVGEYRTLKQQADAAYAAYLAAEEEKKAKQKQKDKPGGPDAYLLRINKNSRLFTQMVLDAYKSGTVPPTEASYLLNTSVNKFQKLEAVLYP